MGAGAVGTAEYDRAMTAYSGAGETVIEDLRDVLKAMLGKDSAIGSVDVTEGHNIASFDIDKLMETIKDQKAWQNQSTEAARELKVLWKEFKNKRFGPPGLRDFTYVQDTFDSAKVSMQIARNRIGEDIRATIGSNARSLQGLSETQATEVVEEVIAHMLSDFSISPSIHGTAGSESLENLFLNTNFLELLEKEKGLGNIIRAFETGGEHTAPVDAILNAYLSEYINNDLLKIRRLPTAGQSFDSLSPEAARLYREKYVDIEESLTKSGVLRKATEKYSQFTEYMRARIARSSAVTPVTNVADVHGLSEDMFRFLSETQEGAQRMRIAVTAEDLTQNLRNQFY